MILILADLHLDVWMRDGRDLLAPIAPVMSLIDALIVAGDLSNNPASQWPRCLARIGQLHRPRPGLDRARQSPLLEPASAGWR